VQAAAESVLPVDHFDVFMAVLDTSIKPVMKTRDKLVHWYWGYSPQLPDDLLLLEPDDKVPVHFELRHSPAECELDSRAHIFVITRNFLVVTLRDIRAATDDLGSFMASVEECRTPAVRALALAQLSSKPQIREAVARRRESRQKPPKAVPLSAFGKQRTNMLAWLRPHRS
jgi:hypothetical protein